MTTVGTQKTSRQVSIKQTAKKSLLRRRMELGALVALGVAGYVLVVGVIGTVLWHVWHPLGPITGIAGFGAAIGALTYAIDRSLDAD